MSLMACGVTGSTNAGVHNIPRSIGAAQRHLLFVYACGLLPVYFEIKRSTESLISCFCLLARASPIQLFFFCDVDHS